MGAIPFHVWNKSCNYLYPVYVLRLIRNEIFARHGHSFSNQKLNDFFLSKGFWYSTTLIRTPPNSPKSNYLMSN